MKHTLTTSELKGSLRINIDPDIYANYEDYLKKRIEDYSELISLCFGSDNSDNLTIKYKNLDGDTKERFLLNESLSSFLSIFRKHETIIYNSYYIEQ